MFTSLRLQTWLVGCFGALSFWGCGTAEVAPTVEPARAGGRWPEVVVVAAQDEAPEGSDGVPRSSLAFAYADGSRVPIAEQARSFTPFRDGVALVDREGVLLLISPGGARRVLARQSGAPPVRGSSGELVYVARHGLRAELHVLTAQGVDSVLASGFANAGVLAPQPDGRVLFVAARSGGVAGLWVADAAGGRCLTNCQLGRAPWGDAFVPPPGHRDAIRVVGDRVQWEAFDGTRRTVDLALAARPPTRPTRLTPELPEVGQPQPVLGAER